MEITDYIELTLSDGRTVRLNVVKMTEVTVTKGADGLYRDPEGNVVELD